MRGLVKPFLMAGMLVGLVMLLAYTAVHGEALTDMKLRFGALAPESPQANGGVEASDSFYTPQTQGVPDDPGISNLLTESINEVDHRTPLDATLRGDPEARDRVTYDNVIDQFAVEENPRYKPRDDQSSVYDADAGACAVEFVNPGSGGCLPTSITYCHTFVWDVTRAMEAEIPYWLDMDGQPNELELTEHGWELWLPAYWLSARGMNQWLNEAGPQFGWREVSAEKAQELANLGHPTVASVNEPQGFGHIGIVRPGEMINGPALAQAGTKNANHAHVYDFFPRENTQFFAHE
jgi:hypothetical protein